MASRFFARSSARSAASRGVVVSSGGSGTGLLMRFTYEVEPSRCRFSHGEEVAALCGVRKPVIGTRPDISPPAQSRHNALAGSKLAGGNYADLGTE